MMSLEVAVTIATVVIGAVLLVATANPGGLAGFANVYWTRQEVRPTAY